MLEQHKKACITSSATVYLLLSSRKYSDFQPRNTLFRSRGLFRYVTFLSPTADILMEAASFQKSHAASSRSIVFRSHRDASSGIDDQKR